MPGLCTLLPESLRRITSDASRTSLMVLITHGRPQTKWSSMALSEQSETRRPDPLLQLEMAPASSRYKPSLPLNKPSSKSGISPVSGNLLTQPGTQPINRHSCQIDGLVETFATSRGPEPRTSCRGGGYLRISGPYSMYGWERLYLRHIN